MFKRKSNKKQYPIVTTEMRYLPGTTEVIEFRLMEYEKYWIAYDLVSGGASSGEKDTREEAIEAFLHNTLFIRKEKKLYEEARIAELAKARKKKIEKYAADFLSDFLLNPAILTAMTPDQVIERAFMIAESFVDQLEKG